MQFAQPVWLAAGVLACALLAWGCRRFDSSQRTALSKFAAARLLPKLTLSISPRRRLLKRGLVIAGVAFLFAALARPQHGFEMRETHRKGLELVFAMDTSKSMLAQDVKPDRLTRARLGVTDLVARLQGDGVGLIAFAGNAFLQCPVTLDYDAFRESLNALDTGTIPLGGTNIAAAIREAEAVFAERNPAEKILVLLTDGEDLGGDGITAAEAAAKKGVKIFTVGVGNTTGELVPIPAAGGGTEFARDDKGQLVKSQLDETTLRKIAEVTGGMYQPLGSQAEGLNAIYDRGLANFSRSDLSSREAKVPLERFQWPLLAALLCFVADWVIGNRRRAAALKPEPPPLAPVRKKLPSPPARATVGAVSSVSTMMIILAALTAAPEARAAATPQSAEQAYQKGDYAKAHQDYAATAAAQPAKPELQFNSGSAAYKAGDYSQAVTGFQESLKNAPVTVQQDAYYNLGNTQYRLGQKTEKEKPEETIKTWEEAVKSYEAALQITPSDTAAKHNRDLVKRKIEQLKKQEEQKKQDQENKDDNKDQKDKKDDKDKDSKDQKDQQNKDQQQDSKDQKDSKDGKDGSQDPKDQQNAGKDKEQQEKEKEDQQKNGEPKNPEDSKDQKTPDQPDQSEKSDKPGDKPKDQKADAADDKKDPGKEGEKAAQDQPEPVNPDKKPQQGDIQPADGTKPPEPPDADAADRVRLAPGQMTREEAKQLLDALKADERKVPAISAQGRAGTQPKNTSKLKDW
ncbi:MAG: VWA domain-containing protein [Verrucomicrobiota bacterium]